MKIFNKPSIRKSPSDIKPRLTIENGERMTIANVPEDFWITGFKGGMEPNYQVLASLGSEIYINSFNEKLTAWNMSGYFTTTECESTKVDKPTYLDLYATNNVNTGKPVTVTYSNMVMRGFIVRLSVSSDAGDAHKGDKFVLSLIGKVSTN